MGSRRFPRTRLTRLLAAVAVLGVLLAFHRARTRRVETLRSSIIVAGWSSSGLRLSGHDVLPLPDFESLPYVSPALAEVTKRGIEIGEDGRVHGLLRVHHWCGNDPIREHIARVDIALLLIYLGEGKSLVTLPPAPWVTPNTSTAFSPAGWRIEEFSSFEHWRRTRIPNPATSRPRRAATVSAPIPCQSAGRSPEP